MLNRWNSESAEEETQGPSVKPLTIPEYWAILTGYYGEMVAAYADMKNLLKLAEDRNEVILITPLNFGATIDVPMNNPRSLVISRPSLAELRVSFAHDLEIRFDDNTQYVVGQNVPSVIPVFSGRTFRVTSGALTPNPGWAIPFVFTNRLYTPKNA